MTIFLAFLLPVVLSVGFALLTWLLPAEAMPPHLDPAKMERRIDHERHHQRVTRDWRAIVKRKREERARQAEARRQEDWIIVRRNFPQWLADLGDAFSALDYDACFEMARYLCLALNYADHHLEGRFSVRALYRHAADIGPVENPRLHTREFFEALGPVLEAQEYLTPNRGNRGRRVQPDALERLVKKLPTSISREMFGR